MFFIYFQHDIWICYVFLFAGKIMDSGDCETEDDPVEICGSPDEETLLSR